VPGSSDRQKKRVAEFDLDDPDFFTEGLDSTTLLEEAEQKKLQ
jgi:hypothetical protein